MLKTKPAKTGKKWEKGESGDIQQTQKQEEQKKELRPPGKKGLPLWTFGSTAARPKKKKSQIQY